MRLGAGRGALIRSERRVALDEFHAVKRNAELFGDQLGLRGVEPVAQFTFAGVSGHAAVRGNGDPGIELIAARTIKALRRRQSAREPCHAESDNQRAGSLHEIPARHPGFLQRGPCVGC